MAPPRIREQFFRNLNRHFLDALENVTRLAIIGDEDGALGQRDYREILIPLKPKHTPKLKELELGYYFIQDDLMDFLVARTLTLEV